MAVQTINLQLPTRVAPSATAEIATVQIPQRVAPAAVEEITPVAPGTYRIGVLPPPDPEQIGWTSESFIEAFDRQLAAYEAQVNDFNAAVDLYNANKGPDPGDWTGSPPQFDADTYSSLLLSEFERDLAAQKEQFDLARAAETEAYNEQLAAFKEEQAILEKENAAAQAAAQAAAAAASEQAAQALKELESGKARFKQETETYQRTSGAQRSAYVRARRIRSRPLLGL